jgi:excisionase family DNA binding protein
MGKENSKYKPQCCREDEWIRLFRPKPVYRTGDVAGVLSMSYKEVTSLCTSGSMPFWFIPGSSHRRISHDALKEWLRNQPDFGFALERLEWAEKLASRMNGVANA